MTATRLEHDGSEGILLTVAERDDERSPATRFEVDKEEGRRFGLLRQEATSLRGEPVERQREIAHLRGEPSHRVKTLAFYLPQYHPIPENDHWWGAGFTDWANVRRGRPAFRGHQQPLLPSELGFYDLREPEVRARQAALAREHGIHGFCYYYYWFHGKKLLERPIEEMLATGAPDFPFCLCWANENWTRRWDGEDQEILIEQRHSPRSDARFIDDVLPALLDPRYVTCDGKPVLLVYRADLLADPLATTKSWREAAFRAGLPGLHLCCVWRVENPLAIGFDAMVEFPPHHFRQEKITSAVQPTNGFVGEVFDYAAGVERIEPLADKPFPVYRGVMPGWDNTARRGKRAWIFTGSTPERYGEWLQQVAQEAADRPGDGDRFVFINAWNEWAEGATLEPSQQHGLAYLEATRAALERVQAHSGLTLLERRLSRRLANLESRLGNLDDRREERHGEVDLVLEQQQRALRWLRDGEEHLTHTAKHHQTLLNEQHTLLSQLQAELSRRSGEWSRRLYEIRIRMDDRPARDLWLSLHCGLAGLLLKLPAWLASGRLRSRLDAWRTARRIRRSGLFAPDYYLERYPEVAAAGLDPLYHYVRYGAAERRDPNPFFSARRYVERFPEVAEHGANPLLHYLEHPARETDGPNVVPGSQAESAPAALLGTVRWALNEAHVAKRTEATTKLLFVAHDAARAGAQVYLLEVLEHFSRLSGLELYLLLRRGGELRAEYERYAHVLDLAECTAAGLSEASAVAAAVRALGRPPAVALCNTVCSGAVASVLHDLDLPVVSIVHELPTTIDALGEDALEDTISSSDRVVVVSEYVKTALVERYGISSAGLGVLHAGVPGWRPETECRNTARRRIFAAYDLPDDAVLVLGCGSIHHRKGTDLFVQVARCAVVDHGLDRVHFLWVGGDQQGPLFRSWCEHDVAAFGLRNRVVFTGHVDSTVDFYLAADVFLLTSREDPFPLANLEAMARGLPVVAFEGAGGAPEALADGAGVVIPYLDTAEMSRALVRLVEAPRYREAVGARARARAEERFRWDRFIRQLRELLLSCAVREPDRSAVA